MASPPISPQRWQALSPILDQALDLPAEQVPAYLDEVCAGDAELRRDVEALLAADENSRTFLDTPIEEYAAPLVRDGEDPPLAFSESQIGPYEVKKMLGSGGMGVVYEAWDPRLERRVAIKLLPRGVSQNHAAKQRFTREARSASALDHANICAIHDIGEEDGRLYIVMAHYPGETLEEKMEKGALSMDEARDLGLQIARGLQRAHQAGIVHRDIKPANIIVTEHGEAKILDFGIAKMLAATSLTRTGMSPGTPAYMSPEQARGETVDARSDIFSLGVLLYQMVAGQRPFRGETPLAMAYTVVHNQPQPLHKLRPEVPADLERVIARAMAKDAGKRFADIGEMVDALAATAGPKVASLSATDLLQRQLRPGQGRKVGMAAAVVVIGLAVALWLGRGALLPPLPVATSTKTSTSTITDANAPTSLAVLRFRNTAGQSELDWLRDGLTEMLSIELAQSPALTVLGHTRLAQILTEIQLPDNAPPLVETIRELASRGGIGAVLVGSYLKLGETFQVNFSLLDSEGEPLVTNSFQERGEEGVFSLVDRVGAAVRGRFEAVRSNEEPASISMITTSSLNAWRLYQEGLVLLRQSKLPEATTLLEGAIELDPRFALAQHDLAVVYRDQGENGLADQYFQAAARQADRLPLDYRYITRAGVYTSQWSTYNRALELYRKGAVQFSDRPFFRSQVGYYSAALEKYEEAGEAYDVRLGQKPSDQRASFSAAKVATALGDRDKTLSIMADLVRVKGGDWLSRSMFAWHLMHWDRLVEAEEQLRGASELRPGTRTGHYTDWRLAVLLEDWPRAEANADAILAMNNPPSTWRGRVISARNLIYRGQATEALRHYEEAVRAFAEPDVSTALARCWAAEVLLAHGQPDEAFDQALRARDEGRGQWPELKALYLAALAEAHRGREAAADTLEADLRQRWQSRPNRVEERQLLLLGGRRALLRGDLDRALTYLRAASELLSVRGIELKHKLPDQVPVWVALGEAELRAGHLDAAKEWLTRAATSNTEHIEHPIPWIRAFYHLGVLYRQKGNEDESRRVFQRFLDFWSGGELDRSRIDEARAAVDGVSGQR